MTKVKTIQKPKLTEKQRDILLKTPLYKRIGLSLREYSNEDILKVQEKEFAQRFTDLGYSIRWISRAQPSKNGGYIPTNDFEWNGIEWELKSLAKAKYGSIRALIKRGALSGKKNFIVDLKGALLRSKLSKQLSSYNKNNPENKISRLLVLDREGLKKIILQK